MIINGKTIVVVNGRECRMLSSRFNEVLRRARAGQVDDVRVLDTNGRLLVPSSGRSWNEVANAVRSGKTVQAKTEGK